MNNNVILLSFSPQKNIPIIMCLVKNKSSWSNSYSNITPPPNTPQLYTPLYTVYIYSIIIPMYCFSVCK